MGKWPRPGTGQPQNPQPASSNCSACQGFGGKYERSFNTGKREWVQCSSCGGSGKKGN